MIPFRRPRTLTLDASEQPNKRGKPDPAAQDATSSVNVDQPNVVPTQVAGANVSNLVRPSVARTSSNNGAVGTVSPADVQTTTDNAADHGSGALGTHIAGNPQSAQTAGTE